MLALAAALFVLAPAQDAIKVGALFSQTGNFSEVDLPGLNGFRLAADQINAKGGVLGRKIEVVAPDYQSKPALAEEITRKLVKDGVVAMGGFYDTDYAIPAGRVAEREHIPMVTSGATLPTLPEKIGQWFFMACYGDDDQARAGAWFAKRGLDAQSAAVLIDVDATYTSHLGSYFVKAYEGMGGKVTQMVTFHETDSPADVVKRLRSPGQAIYVSSLPDKAGPFVAELRKAGYHQPILSGDGFDTPDLAKVAGKAAHQVFYTTHYAPNSPLPATKEFKSAYHEKYGVWPESASAALAYDTMNLIANAIDRASSTEPAKIRYALAETRNLHGITGVISYSPGVRKPAKSIYILGLRNGREELVKTVEPGG